MQYRRWLNELWHKLEETKSLYFRIKTFTTIDVSPDCQIEQIRAESSFSLCSRIMKPNTEYTSGEIESAFKQASWRINNFAKLVNSINLDESQESINVIMSEKKYLPESEKIQKMKDLLYEHTGGDSKFVDCYGCGDMSILYAPGGTFTENSWQYCRYCCDKYWCGKCNVGWSEKESKCSHCIEQDEK